MATQRKNISNMSVTKSELNRLVDALKHDEFRALLADYAKEVSDPINRQQYEREFTKMEGERGNRCVFLHPKPGFVVKTATLRTDEKTFVNVCSREQPSTRAALSSSSGSDSK